MLVTTEETFRPQKRKQRALLPSTTGMYYNMYCLAEVQRLSLALELHSRAKGELASNTRGVVDTNTARTAVVDNLQ